MPKKRKYTQAQKKAYYCGMGYRAAQKNKRIAFKSSANRESFRAGCNAANKFR